MITQQTAYDIWVAYDEIAKGQKLIADMEKELKDGNDPNPQDPFGRRRNLQLGVPCGDNAHRLFDVQPKLAIAVIRAHIAEKQAFLQLACERARAELVAANYVVRPATGVILTDINQELKK